MTFTDYKEVEPWEDSYNTVTRQGARATGYLEWKERKEEQVLRAVIARFPALKDLIRSVHSSTPLTMRDYLSAPRGTTYGLHRDHEDPMSVYVAPRTKVPNLLLTGQNVNVHGILGVTVSAVLTCAELLGKEYLVRKIQAAS